MVNLGAFAVAALVARTAPTGPARPTTAACTRPGRWPPSRSPSSCCAWPGCRPGVIGLFAKVAVFSSAVDAEHGWLAVIMAVNVVIALVYYLRWTALLFARRRSAGSADRPAAGAAPAGRCRPRPAGAADAWPLRRPVRPSRLAAAIALTAVGGLVLSGAPQIVLRYAQGTLL